MTADLRERVVNAAGIKTRCWEAGEGEPVVLVHGGGAGADGYSNWRGIVPRLADRFHVVAVDMIGFGGTDCPDPATTTYSQDARNEHLVAFLDAMGFDQACLVGNSMGGGTSLGVAMSAPHRVRQLVLMGSAGLSKGPPSPALRTIVEYREPSLDAMRATFRALTSPHFAVDEELVRYRYELTLDEARMAAYRAIQEWSKEAGGLWYEEDAIAAVEAPTLIVHGRLDQVVGVEQAYRFGELLPNSWLYVIPHCGHWAMIERPDDFATITECFLARDW